jgi:hypothetical protein
LYKQQIARECNGVRKHSLSVTAAVFPDKIIMTSFIVLVALALHYSASKTLRPQRAKRFVKHIILCDHGVPSLPGADWANLVNGNRVVQLKSTSAINPFSTLKKALDDLIEKFPLADRVLDVRIPKGYDSTAVAQKLTDQLDLNYQPADISKTKFKFTVYEFTPP